MDLNSYPRGSGRIPTVQPFIELRVRAAPWYTNMTSSSLAANRAKKPTSKYSWSKATEADQDLVQP